MREGSGDGLKVVAMEVGEEGVRKVLEGGVEDGVLRGEELGSLGVGGF